MDSSLVVVPPAVGRPLRLLPFRGWRLTPGRIGDPATARLFARPYRDVAERLDRWREAGQLLEDHQPAVYVHEYTAAGLTVEVTNYPPLLVASLNLTSESDTPTSLPTWLTRAACASGTATRASAIAVAAMVRVRFIGYLRGSMPSSPPTRAA